ncbi:MAG: TspO/MBR family protein [Pseudomonadota bacterium]|nr:TspO/MBR family protein [Pseudomonadota bacterium]
MEKFNFERNLKNWLICVTVFITVTMVINGLIALIGWEGDETRFTEGPNRLPPGWIIGLVWTILFIGMASAFWMLASSTEITSRRKAGEVLAFAIFCLSYPIFTIGFSVHFLVFSGNLLCIVWSSYLTGVLRDISRPASALMVLPAIWVCYATWALITPAG